MKRAALPVLLLCAAYSANSFAVADSGNVVFNGKVTAPTCTLYRTNVNVAMPDVTLEQLASPGHSSSKPFAIQFRECASQYVDVTFNPVGAPVNNLFPLKPGGAKNVGIRIRESDGAQMIPGEPERTRVDANYMKELTFHAEYVPYRSNAHGATGGRADALVEFVLSYQ